MNKLKLLILGLAVFAISCNNADQNDSKNGDSTKIEVTVDVENTDIDKNTENKDVSNITVKEVPDSAIMAETIPKTNGFFEAAGINSDEQIYIFVRELRANVQNKNNLSEMISYPIKANINGTKTEIANKESFVENFDQIFNKKISSAVKKSNYYDLFCNYQGVMIGDGEIWMGLVDGKIKIIAINN
ncbi:MAG: hypothetical protein JXL97_13470 [Bacteroidales bacterium]|nr:hypothetical protein [Bacteroidales bacterium]